MSAALTIKEVMDLLEVDLKEAAFDLELEFVAHISDLSEEVLHGAGYDASLFFVAGLASLVNKRSSHLHGEGLPAARLPVGEYCAIISFKHS